MLPLLLIAALAPPAQARTPVPNPPPPSCVAQHFAPLLRWEGVPRHWVKNKEVELDLGSNPRESIGKPGVTSHGYYYRFHRPSAEAEHGYVVQMAG